MKMNEIVLADCMDIMKNIPDKYFELAIVDPPYGINVCSMGLGKGGGLYRGEKNYKLGQWDSQAPDLNYFNELYRISKNQIIWGANHFIETINKNSSAWIFWDKNNGASDFADGELAWSSFEKPVRKFKYTWSGFIQENMGKNKEERQHPTQKPIALYRWLLQNYAKPGDKIIDTHSGSGSLACACHLEGFDFLAIEKDEDYYKASCERLDTLRSQGTLF